jgi:predicted Zn-dependent protease
MIVWKDWDGVAQLISSVPVAQRTRQDQLTLAQVQLMVGNYQEASSVAGPLAEAAPTDLEANSLAGRAWYHEGRYDEAARAFDRVWNSLISARRVEDIMMRGLIYFYRNDHQKAIETLNTALRLQPDYYPGYGALSRVYRAMGKTEQAEEYQRQGAEALARQTTERARQSRFASGLRELELAWNERRYEDVVRITQDLLQKDTNSPQRPVLYQYLSQAYQALGRTAEAQAAQAEATRLRSNQPQQ